MENVHHTGHFPYVKMLSPTPFEQAHLIGQWKEEFRRRSRVKCPCSGCWLEFPSIYGVKYHYQRCQGVSRQTNVRSSSVASCMLIVDSSECKEENHDSPMDKSIMRAGKKNPSSIFSVARVCVHIRQR